MILGVVLAFSFFAGSAGALQERVTARHNELVVSGDADFYARLTAEGNRVSVSGYFKGETIDQIYIGSATLSGVKQGLSAEADGSFTGYYEAVPKSGYYGQLVLKFKSGQQTFYRVEYDGGWYFPDNGLADYTMNNIENYIQMADEVAAGYISADYDPDEISQTLRELRRIAEEVTAGIDDSYQKAKALNTWVSDNIYYDHDASEGIITSETVTLYNILITKRTVCSGYANIYAALLECAGIKAVSINGGAVGDGCTYEQLAEKTLVHEWTAFWYEEEARWVVVDPCWDSGCTYEDGQYVYRAKIKRHFDRSPLAFSMTHRGDRAELRAYTRANQYVQSLGGVAAEETEATTEIPQTEEAEESSTPRTLFTQPEVTVDAQEEFAEDLAAFYGVIVVMVVMIVGLLIVLILSKFKGKGRK